MRILFIGDVVGAAGMSAVKSMLPDAISRWKVLDLAVVNGENSAGGGFGITEDTYQGIRGAGADVVTLGNHSWARKEALSFIGTEPRLVRPLNYVPGTPGQGFVRVETAGGKRVLVVNALGRLFRDGRPTTRSAPSTVSCRPTSSDGMSTRSSWTSIAKRPERNRRWDISATDASVSSWARTRTRRAPITASLPAARPTSPTSA